MITTTNFLSSHLFLCIILNLSNPFESPTSNFCFMWASFPAFEARKLSLLLAILVYLLH